MDGRGSPWQNDDNTPRFPSAEARDRARELRKRSTDAERLLWRELRDHRLMGYKFRRQVPIGPYIADFYSRTLRLAIELDGSQHFDDDHASKDRLRDIDLLSRGVKILRFDDREILLNLESVMTAIHASANARALEALTQS